MVPKPLIYFSQIAHAASHNVRVPKPIAFFVRIISNLQVLSLIFCDSVLSAQTDDSTFTRSLKTFISSVRSVLMLSDINSEAFVAIIAYIGFIYLLIQLIFMVYFIIQIKRGQNPHPWACKLFPVLMHLHSQVVFYPFHCLFLRLISSYVDCSNGSDTTSFYCGLHWVILPSFFEVLNVILPFFTELYCFQILFKRGSFSQKENIYPMLVLSQKTLLVAFLYFLNNPQTTMILLNIMFCLVSFYILHSRLTYYDLKLLRLEIAFSTCALLFSVFMIAQAFGNNADILLLMLWIAILAIKLSLRQLDTTLKQILKLKFKNPHQAAHLSCVIKEQIDYARLQNGRKFNRGALFASGLLINYMEGEEMNFQNKEMLKKAKVQAYMMTIQKLEDLLKVYPNNQLLVLSIAQIHMKKLKDSSKTLYLLDRVKTQNISIPIKNSIQTLCSQLDKLYSAAAQETKEKLGYLHYFEYRDKTIKLKDMIEQELNLQLKLWQAFNTDPINAYHVIEQARTIDRSESKIYSYWQKEVQNLEKLYVNAPILFGLYLEIVRGLPYTGSALIQQTYRMIVEKGVLQEDILSVSVGKSAIIIASGEAEKAGKVIDASASVKELFGIDKNYLIHSNLNLILPKTISQKHDQLIRKFHEKPSEEQNGHVKSYAKTLNDQYFPVDISLRPLPSSNGLNIVAYIKKMSSNISLMIIDYHGRVVECSKDLQKMLNFDTRGTIELSKVCPRLVHVSQAYNIVYAPEEIPPEGMEEKDYFDTPLESPVTTEFPANKFKESNNNGIGLKSIFMRRNRVNTVMSGHQLLETDLASPTLKPLKDKEDSIIYSPTEVVNLKETMKSSSIPNNPNSDSLQIDKNNSETIELKEPSYGASRKNQDNPFQMSREDAEAVCYRFKKKKKLKFTIPASGTSKGVEIVPFETQVEPFRFAGQLYKIVKVRKMTEADFKEQSLVPSALAPFQKQLVNKLHSIEQTNGNGASLLFAKPGEEITRSDKKKTSITPFVSAGDQSVGDMSDNGKTTAQLDYVSENEDENHSFKDDITEYLTELDIPELRVSRASRTGSVINSSIGSTKNRAKYLDALFKRETISYATRVAIITAYLSVAVVIGSVGVDLAFTQKALREMEASIELIYISNARLFKLIAAWRGVLILYSRTAGVRPNNNARTITVFSQQIYNYTLDMLSNNDLLRQKVDAFQNEYITELFYRKNVELWLPYENQMLTGEPVDLFTANQVIATKMYFVSSFKNTPMGLLNLSEPLFAQNNTANDYLIAVQDTISELSAFFENTANNNVSLLKVIVALESLALVIPFVSLLILFKIITTSHQKLFRVISKIRKKNVEARIAQLNKMSTYLKKNVEDSVIIYKDDISSQLTKAKMEKHKDGGDDPMSRSRLYTLKTLIWRMALYLIFTLVLFTVITVLFWTSFNSATSGFTQLIRLNSQVNTAFYYGSYISSLLSEFYYVLIFAGQSSFKIRNDSPNNQLKTTIRILGEANQGLVTALSTPGKGIDDPWIESFLNRRICDYDLPANKGNCGLVTLKNGVGLLGLNERFYTVCGVPMLIYLAAPTPTLGVSTMNTIVNDLGNFHTTAMDVYQVLADTLYAKVLVKKEEEEDLTLVYFKWNLVVIVIVMLLVRIVVIRKYKSLDLSVKKILKLIPFHIIQNNKAIMFYLSKEFESEISDLTKMKN